MENNLKFIPEYISYYDYGNEASKNFLFSQDPFFLVCILVGYIMLIFYSRKYVQRNTPIRLKKFVLIYNMLNIWFCLILSSNSLSCMTNVESFLLRHAREVFPLKTGWGAKMVSINYWFMMLKIFQLLDTSILILLKKLRHFTFRYILHRFLPIILIWLQFKDIPGPPAMMFVCASTSMDLAMYLYYTVVAFRNTFNTFYVKQYVAAFQAIKVLTIFWHSLFMVFFGKIIPFYFKFLYHSYGFCLLFNFFVFYVKEFVEHSL